MTFNLSRNTVVYISTVTTGFNTTNTFEVPVLDGYSFSQDTSSDSVGLNEAGLTPVRGQKVFNTAVNPADVSFTTYIRPYISATKHTCVERVLWEALVGDGAAGVTGDTGTNTTSTTSSFKADFEGSDKHELLKLYIYFKMDNTVYKVSEVQLSQAEIDFSIDGISQISWTGQGTTLDKDNTPITAPWVGGVDYLAADTSGKFIKNKLSTLSIVDNGSAVTPGYNTISFDASTILGTDTPSFDGSSTYDAAITVDGGSAQTISIDSSAFSGTVNDALKIINSQLDGANVELNDAGTIVITSVSKGTSSSIGVAAVSAANNLFGNGTDTFGIQPAGIAYTSAIATGGVGSGTTYNIPITGGSLSINNNITFLTPEELGKVNSPIGSFSGTREISGSMSAYLRTGSSESGGLIDTLLADLSTVTQDFKVEVSAGGASAPNAAFTMNHAHLVIPSTQVEDVISTTIEFTGLGQDLEFADELLVEYKAV